MKTNKPVYKVCGKEVTKGQWDKNLQYTMPASEARGVADHTPGPWAIGKRQESDNTLDIVWESGTDSYNKKQLVASISPVGEWSTGYQTANARLIAASPELLAVARLALEALKVTPEESVSGSRHQAALRVRAKRALRLAIAKVEGK